jgi:hypothetical protein
MSKILVFQEHSAASTASSDCVSELLQLRAAAAAAAATATSAGSKRKIDEADIKSDVKKASFLFF